MAAPDDEDAIEAVAADGAHPALGECVRVRRSDRRPDPLGAEDLVEGAAELRVAVMDQQLERLLLLGQLHDNVPGLLSHPGAVWAGCTGDELEPAPCQREEEKHVDPL